MYIDRVLYDFFGEFSYFVVVDVCYIFFESDFYDKYFGLIRVFILLNQYLGQLFGNKIRYIVIDVVIVQDDLGVIV